MQKNKKGFLMPTTKNGFHIFNLHPKIYRFLKNTLFFKPIYKKKFSLFLQLKN